MRTDRINWTLFVIHLLVTILTLTYLKIPTILLDVRQLNQDDLTKAITFRVKLLPATRTLFIAGQILFLIYYIRTIKAERIAKTG